MTSFSPTLSLLANRSGDRGIRANVKRVWQRSLQQPFQRQLRRVLGVTIGGLAGVMLLGGLGAMAPAGAEPIAPSAEETPLTGDGVYFYGQAPTPDELGAGYLVFEAQGDRVVGAIYMPFSSFDCFQGRIAGDNLALQITNSYTQETYDYAIALEPIDAIAGGSGGAAPLSLSGFYNLGAAGEAELGLLQTCQGAIAPDAELEI